MFLIQVGLITMQTTNHQNGEHVPRRHRLIRCVHQACRELGITYWRPRQRGALLDKGPIHDATQEEPSYHLGDFDKAEAAAAKSSAANSPANTSAAIRLSYRCPSTGSAAGLRGILRARSKETSQDLQTTPARRPYLDRWSGTTSHPDLEATGVAGSPLRRDRAMVRASAETEETQHEFSSKSKEVII